MMEVLVGSKNPVKIEATKEVFSKYFGQVKVSGIEVSSKVSAQPINEETFEGAKNRALELKKLNKEKNLGADFFVGIERGITKLYSKWFALGVGCIRNCGLNIIRRENVKRIFSLTVIFVFLAIFVESTNLILQLKGRRLTKWFGKNAFSIHMITTGIFWMIAFCLIAILQFEDHPLFHNIIVLKYVGLILLISGLILACWAFKLLGLKRALCLNFFEENVPVVKESLYKYIKNPADYGLWIALIGFAIFTRSIYNLAVAVEFIIIMIPHIILENKPLNK